MIVKLVMLLSLLVSAYLNSYFCCNYREFAQVYSLQQEGRNPLKEDPLRTPFSGGKRRGGALQTIDLNQSQMLDSSRGVRFN